MCRIENYCAIQLKYECWLRDNIWNCKNAKKIHLSLDERLERGGPSWLLNGDSKCTYERGPSLVGSMGSSCQYTRFFSAIVGQIQNNFQLLCDAAFYWYFLEFYIFYIFVTHHSDSSVITGDLSVHLSWLSFADKLWRCWKTKHLCNVHENVVIKNLKKLKMASI